MNHKVYIALLLIMLPFLLSCTADQTADLVLFNGKIYAVAPDNAVVEAVAVKDGKILKTGTALEIKSLVGKAREEGSRKPVVVIKRGLSEDTTVAINEHSIEVKPSETGTVVTLSADGDIVTHDLRIPSEDATSIDETH